jgi:predicted dithiol-disulfide oxidoreductase (DUF899 family)
MATNRPPIRFPGETPEYRTARDSLFEAERDLRRRIEQVAVLRRALPVGGAVSQDYVFQAASTDDPDRSQPVRLSQLFATGQDNLILYSFMYGPAMKQACTSCTSILDALDGEAPHVSDRVSLAVIAKSPLTRIRAFARERGWRNLRLVSSSGNTYNTDYHAENAEGVQLPALNVFVRRNGRIHHFYNTELLYAPTEPGQNGRHVDLIWPLWNLFDLTPEGRGTDWFPRLTYNA